MALDPLTAVFDLGGKILDKFFPDPAQRDAAKLELLRMQQTGELAKLAAETDLAKGQMAINAEEAKSEKLFVAGWRPMVGWICAVAMGYHFILQPLIVFLMLANGSKVEVPAFDMESLWTVLCGLLGLGGLRTFEKTKLSK